MSSVARFTTHPYYHALRGAVANIALVWGSVALYEFLPYYQSFLGAQASAIIFSFALIYTISAPFLAIRRKHHKSKGEEIIAACIRFLTGLYYYVSRPHASPPKITSAEKTTLLFFLIKFYFTPMMVQFAVGNYHGIVNNLINLTKVEFGSLATTVILVYPLILALIFFIDTTYFAFDYLVESDLLKNKVRSVEPTLLGWVAALLCYPPFNWAITGSIIPWFPNDNIRFFSTEATAVAYFVIILLYTIYVYATISLGTKCSNLTNRGIVSSGPYAYVRHPHYISKNLAWWITLIPIMSVPVFLSMAAWTLIYAIRAITEERHLLADPEYQEYVRKVKYRFIPRIL